MEKSLRTPNKTHPDHLVCNKITKTNVRPMNVERPTSRTNQKVMRITFIVPVRFKNFIYVILVTI